MHVIQFLADLENPEICHVNLLKIDLNTVVLPEIIKILGLLTGNICSGVSFQYIYGW